MATRVDLDNKGDCLFLLVDLFGHNYYGPAKIFMRAKISETIGNALARILDDESLTVSKPEAFQNWVFLLDRNGNRHARPSYPGVRIQVLARTTSKR
ncbi:hypothetical protein DPMN_070475 [Dreissena polymorpha]|uniref:Uncharacterized protein n=1 Tax=Dreissena polymorpha TaxID=45954 RepID=A0A9D3Z318_DREPO|nr:hypothetical protein DPMN_070475 [Dreissena polymorpha]